MRHASCGFVAGVYEFENISSFYAPTSSYFINTTYGNQSDIHSNMQSTVQLIASIRVFFIITDHKGTLPSSFLQSTCHYCTKR